MVLRRRLSAFAVLAAAMIAAPAQSWAAPTFKAPFARGQKWTYSHHSAEVRRALDFVRSDGGATLGAPVPASAAGTATRMSQPSGAGNCIVIDHGGWKTHYFHLASYSVPSGAAVGQGQQIDTTGSTGNAEGHTNNWWSRLRDQGGFISNIYVDHPDAKLPGVPLC